MEHEMKKGGFEYQLVSSVLHDAASVEAIFLAYEPLFSSLRGKRLSMEDGTAGGKVCGAKVPIFFILTGGTEGSVLRALDAMQRGGKALPIILVAHTRHNSLPAALEIAARVRQDGGRTLLVLLCEPDGKASQPELEKALKLVGLVEAMRASKIGAVGEPSDWLVASSQKAEDLSRVWGLTLESVGLDALRSEMAGTTAESDENAIAKSFLDKARFLGEPRWADVKASIAVYKGLKSLARSKGFDALTLRCFDLVTAEKVTGCFALSQLADEGIDSGCEGDVASIVALRWMRLLSGKPAWMANPSDISFSGNKGTILLAHCTVPRSLLSGYGIRSHFESGLGVAVAGTIPPGPVTLVRLGGKSLEKAWVAEGVLLETQTREGLCRTQALVKLDADDLRKFIEKPLGNHIVLGIGRQGDMARQYLEVEGMDIV